MNFSNVLMDQAILSFDERFPQMTEFRQTFGFLFNVHTFKGINCDVTTSALQER